MSQFTAEEQHRLASVLHEVDSAPNVRASVGAALEMPSSDDVRDCRTRRCGTAGLNDFRAQFVGNSTFTVRHPAGNSLITEPPPSSGSHNGREDAAIRKLRIRG
jgi:hypothetical protein